MGEARAKKRTHDAKLKSHPWCIYCGAAATTIDHMPPIAMFRGRQRPKGLEFPSCVDCNSGTRHADLVASLIGRVYPDPPDESGATELRSLLAAVSNNIPGLLEEMQVGRAGQKLARHQMRNMPKETGVLRVGGPLVFSYMRAFGAKLGFAFHFEIHGVPVPAQGGVQPILFSNVQAANGQLPMELIKMLPSHRTLTQGKREAGDQFQYSWLVTEERRHTVFYAVFRASFAVAAVTFVDRSEVLSGEADKHPIFAPGDFRRT